jgi:hypothetical protein
MANGAIWKVRGHTDEFALSIEGLYNAFVKAVKAYEEDLKADPDIQRKFEKMFDIDGSMPVWSASMNKLSA